jgi:predicted permease
MELIQRLGARLRGLLRRTSGDRELSEEIRFHIERETEKNVRSGMSSAEARRVAVAHFGGVERVREEHRDVRGLPWLEDAAADARFALRSLRRTPALAAAAIITLALGIGANVAIFSAVNAVVLQPLPFPAPDRLITIGEDNPEKQWHMQFAAAANLLDWRAGVADFQHVSGYFEGVGSGTLTGHGDPQVLRTSTVMGNLFSTLGVRAALGRTFTFEETFSSGTHVTVLSNRAWRQVFGADPAIVGKSIVLDGNSIQVIGVMPAGFSFPADGIDAWQTMEWSPKQRAEVSFRRAHGVRALARLKSGVTIAAANAQLQTVVERLKHQYPATNRVMGASMVPLHDFLIGDTRLPLLVLLTSVAFLLLIACANVGNLLLVQAAGREREAALRLALGAGRGRLVRQALVESMVLSVIGGACGLALGWIGTRLLVRLQPEKMLRVHDFGVDTSVLLYVVGITVVSGLVFGTAPALWFRRRDPSVSLKEGGRGAVLGRTARRWGELLVVSEVALALLMTVGAGLFVRSLLQLRQVDPGFDPHNVLVATVGLSNSYNTDAKSDAFLRQLETRVAALPGVISAGRAMNVPFTGVSWTSDMIAYGRPQADFISEVGNSVVSPSYFATMKEPVLRGRVFTEADRATTTPVLVINETLAKTYFKGQNPVGQRVTFDKVPTPKSTWLTIVGVVGDEHSDGLGVTPRIEAFQSAGQAIAGYANLVVRTRGNPTALTGSVRAALHDMDPTIALLDVTTMDTLRDRTLARTRFITILLLAFALIGVTLAVVGVYGVLAQVARNRTREMGIRLALGAQAAQVRWLVVSQGLRLALIGLVLGALAAVASTRVMGALLFHVAPNDPLTLAAVAALLAVTSLAASWLPALKASRADPALTMRAE